MNINNIINKGSDLIMRMAVVSVVVIHLIKETPIIVEHNIIGYFLIMASFIWVVNAVTPLTLVEENKTTEEIYNG